MGVEAASISDFSIHQEGIGRSYNGGHAVVLSPGHRMSETGTGYAIMVGSNGWEHEPQ